MSAPVGGTSDQRPAAAPRWRAPRSRRDRRRVSVVVRPPAPTRARIAPNPSEVSSPRDTPSQRPRSTSSGSRLVASPSSSAKHAPRARSTSRISAVAPTAGSAGSPPAARPLEQPGEVGAEHDRDRRGLRRRAGRRVGVGAGPGREPQPADLAVVAQPVEPRGVVVAQPAGEQLGLPRDRGGLEALELLDHGGEPGLARELRAGRDVLPAQQEAHEVLRGRGLDALAPRAARVRVHPREQPARDPLRPVRARRVAALEREALVLEHREPCVHAADGGASSPGRARRPS